MKTWIDPKCNRSNWPAGEWDDEPDKAQWLDADTGLSCIAKRHHRTGHWCGYVGVPEGHSWFGKQYDDISARCELTYAAPCSHGAIESSICHVPEPGEPDNVWWLGFDFAHCDDASPQDHCYARDRGYPFDPVIGTYKTLEYVKQVCKELAADIKGVA